MIPHLSTHPLKDGFRYIAINGRRVGPALPEPHDFVVWNWLENAWPELVTATIANANPASAKKPRKGAKKK